MNFTVHLDDREVRAVLTKLDESLGTGFRSALTRVDQILARSINLNFQRQGRPEEWDELSPRTIKRRRDRVRSGGRAPVAGMETRLRDSDALRRSVVARLAENAPGQVSSLTPDDLIRGTSIVYGPTQQFGNEKKRIPARPFMLIQPGDKIEIVREFERDISARVVALHR